MKEQRKKIRIVGLAIVTQEANAPAEIGQLWQRAGAAGVLSETAANFGVYTDYQEGHTGNYRVIVGAESSREPQGDEVAVEIPAGSYRVLRDKGKVPEIVGKAWQEVRSNWQQERSFQVDYERYLGTPEHSDFELCIGVQ